MPGIPLRTLVCVQLAVVGQLLSGCVAATKYKLAKPGGPPAMEIGLTGVAPDCAVTLRQVIVTRGPGSWKREARWDEYVLRLENRSDHPIEVRAAVLDDFEDQPHLPGADPWMLEEASDTEWDRLKRRGVRVVAGAGAVLGYTAVLGGMVAGSGIAAVAAGVIPIVGIVDVAAVTVINHRNKRAVGAEFARRRLELPLTLAPGEVRQGSLFFTMAPGPRRLRFSCGPGAPEEWWALPLPQLAKLHLAPDEV